MRYQLILVAALLAPATPGFAQVTVDLRALDALPKAAPAPPRPVPHHRSAPTAPLPLPPPAPPAQAAATPAKPTPTVANTRPAQHAPAPARQAEAAKPSAPAHTAPSVASTQATRPSPPQAASGPPQLPTMAAAPPPVARISPEPSPTANASAAPPPPPIVAGAGTQASARKDSVRIIFAPDKSDISPASAATIKHLVGSVPTADKPTFNVLAYAPATPGDPSVARRLSLARALAVRSVLMSDGVDPSRIYVRALGSEFGKGPANRVDVALLGGNDQVAPSR